MEPIKSIPAAEEQHMLLLFLPLKKKTNETVAKAVATLNAEAKAGNDLRAATGVHYFMIYHLADGQKPLPALPVTSFQTMPGKDMLVVLSIYDADFAPYIASFVTNPVIAFGLNAIVNAMDETGIMDPEDPRSAAYIKDNGGVAANPDAFNCLLMRYNFGDPTVPAAAKIPANSNYKYVLSATFPGLTVGKILQNYPNAEALWPSTAVDIQYEPSTPPPTC
ncbi:MULTISPECIES: hypothetical protein [unclassified Mucilaginibacter]|uniref:hypothetical protein n=1 Tax=unclassified Mucilaginibacter TaxID=2617802 RepID=UPI002AC8C9BC|nr:MULTISPECIES: hypothetical protein [unclassified Mucilaginibacter]MEB0260315.1 hypothetical protein [Mucilaginibacter sp. 10I4]MEB0279354.1 hypothetical protein [Mucilaginibacter sp. 10B2]MEB0302210.1 hypothetical protein [Mucilaginibacter sp. 5C4]WPX21727.1 hypothetical protein RHM67_10565 [Mucilaginibacter sp. 5C4]